MTGPVACMTRHITDTPGGYPQIFSGPLPGGDSAWGSVQVQKLANDTPGEGCTILDMRATFRGALLALSLIAVGGCTAEGVQGPTEAPTASVSPEVQKVLDAVHSPAAERLRGAADMFAEEGCSSSLETPGCILATSQLAEESGKLRSELEELLPVPAEVEAKASKLLEALVFVGVWADPESDPEHVQQTVDMLNEALAAW